MAWSLGSFATEVQTLVEDVPTYLSGTPIERIAERNIQFVAESTGNTIASSAVELKYQPSVLHLTVADVLDLMDLQGSDTASFHLGDLTVNKGGSSNLASTSKKFREMGMKELERIRKPIKFYKAFG